jgi:response regulator NasT
LSDRKETSADFCRPVRLLARLMLMDSIRTTTGGKTMATTILICDDEPVIRMNLKAMLQEIGFEDVLECSDGKAAVDTALASFPDLVILDVSMPEMDGITAAAEIRKKLKIPILLLTNAYDSKTVKRAAENGIAAFLTKPLRKQDLLPAIEIALQHVEEIEELKEKIEDLRETIENRKIIEKAKGMLMEKNRFSEADAYRAMQKMAMDTRKNLRQVADGILKG